MQKRPDLTKYIEENARWLNDHRRAWVSPKQLRDHGVIKTNEIELMNTLVREMAVRIPSSMQEYVVEQAPSIVNQFVPTASELDKKETELLDPIGDAIKEKAPFLTHRYPDRVLLHVTYHCAVYCRFCFRKNKVSKPFISPNFEDLAPAFSYIASHQEIREVILTGGDPLVLTDDKLCAIVNALDQIPHLDRVRFHTRVPVMLASRITSALIDKLTNLRCQVWIVIHANHASEFHTEASQAVKRLRDARLNLLSQTVLLRGINAHQKDLIELFQCFATHQITPYYLHYLDLAEGTSQFRVPLKDAIELYQSLRGQISGYLIPRFMIDIPGGYGKVVADSGDVRQIDEHLWEMRSPLTGEWRQVQY